MTVSGHADSMNRETTIQQVLLKRLQEEPDGEVCRLVGSSGEVTSVTFRDFMHRAMGFAERFGRPASERQVIGICLYHGLDLHAAFVGGLWAGHVPTMLAPPSPRMEREKYTSSFKRMIEHIKPAWMVVDSSCLAKLDRLALGDLPGTELVNPQDVQARGDIEPWLADQDEVALIQHSSGTTGLQKGVALSHRAVLEHNRAYSQALGISRNDTVVSWLPLYHDMGFIACFLLPLLERILFVELSPFDWVLRPAMLLEQISRHKGTVCWLPNFAYSYLAENVTADQIPNGLSLASVRAWINCSEPVYHLSHLKFYERFRELGVHWGQFTASYAMAENVFAVTQSLPGEYKTLEVDRAAFAKEHRVLPPSGEALTLVSNGRPVRGTAVQVRDETEKPVEDGCAGEFALRGDYLFSGYYQRDDLTRAVMTRDGWYKTGDLGFLYDGHAYVTGRKKDLIIIQGRNFYPTDIEAIASSIEGVIPGRAVAFGLIDQDSGTEKLARVMVEGENEATVHAVAHHLASFFR